MKNSFILAIICTWLISISSFVYADNNLSSLNQNDVHGRNGQDGDNGLISGGNGGDGEDVE